jgi:hypothetical protein
MDNSNNNAIEAGDVEFDRVNLDMTTSDEIKRQMHHMSFGIDALDGLGMMAAHAIDDDIGVTGEQIGSLLKCVEYSLLSTQRKIIAALDASDKERH